MSGLITSALEAVTAITVADTVTRTYAKTAKKSTQHRAPRPTKKTPHNVRDWMWSRK